MFKSIKALAVFLGTIIGVGIFGLPYVASKIGFIPIVFYFVFMSIVVISMHFLFSRVILGTEKLHRMPGYVGEYLGSNWKKFSLLVFSFGLIGALLAYLIVGGEFLNFLLSPIFGGNATLYTSLFFLIGSIFIFRGIKNISGIELSLLIAFFVILGVFFMKALPFINFEYLQTIDLEYLFFPYGVVFFSLGGLAILPEIKEMLANYNQERELRKVIVSGILLATVSYLFFIFIILGSCGSLVSKEAMYGFANILGDNIAGLGFIFGIITCFTSFLTLGLTLKKVFWYDLNIPKHISWFIACFLPFLFFLLGFREFIDIIGLTGAIALGIDGIFIVFIYREFLKRKKIKKINPLVYCLPIFFILGIAFEIFYFILR